MLLEDILLKISDITMETRAVLWLLFKKMQQAKNQFPIFIFSPKNAGWNDINAFQFFCFVSFSLLSTRRRGTFADSFLNASIPKNRHCTRLSGPIIFPVWSCQIFNFTSRMKWEIMCVAVFWLRQLAVMRIHYDQGDTDTWYGIHSQKINIMVQ